MGTFDDLKSKFNDLKTACEYTEKMRSSGVWENYLKKTPDKIRKTTIDKGRDLTQALCTYAMIVKYYELKLKKELIILHKSNMKKKITTAKNLAQIMLNKVRDLACQNPDHSTTKASLMPSLTSEDWKNFVGKPLDLEPVWEPLPQNNPRP